MKSLARARLYMSDTVHDGVDAIPTDDTYLAISRALSITGPNASKPQVEGTDMDDTGRVYEGDLPEQGDLVAELNQDFGDAGQTQGSGRCPNSRPNSLVQDRMDSTNR